ncbi:protein TIC 40, chloroplastic isoform X1 [Helianthus annuus]|nr:protein TIC 40, chloroplastic isoform X1 [Helianthus annuus]
MIENMMDNLALSASSQKLVLGFTTTPRTNATISNKPLFCSFKIPKRSGAIYKSKSSISTPLAVNKLNDAKDCFARISSSSGQHSSSQAGSILFWVGVGVALSPVFSSAASYLKKYAMTMIANKSETSQGSSATSAATVDVPPTKTKPTESKDDNESTKEPKKSAFVDVSPEETLKTSFEKLEESPEAESPKDSEFTNQASENGSAFKLMDSAFKLMDSPSEGPSSTGTKINGMSVEAFDKMMHDPTVQETIYPYLPEEMRNPTSFKWLLQHKHDMYIALFGKERYCQVVQDIVNDKKESPEWHNWMMDSLKNFDPNSPKVKEQFEKVGLTTEEVTSKISANPDIIMAFENPRVQAALLDVCMHVHIMARVENPKVLEAIMDCYLNTSIIKYQNDKEVMDLFNKMSELFPGLTGAP